jgi:hypothetical protein
VTYTYTRTVPDAASTDDIVAVFEALAEIATRRMVDKPDLVTDYAAYLVEELVRVEPRLAR